MSFLTECPALYIRTILAGLQPADSDNAVKNAGVIQDARQGGVA